MMCKQSFNFRSSSTIMVSVMFYESTDLDNLICSMLSAMVGSSYASDEMDGNK